MDCVHSYLPCDAMPLQLGRQGVWLLQTSPFLLSCVNRGTRTKLQCFFVLLCLFFFHRFREAPEVDLQQVTALSSWQSSHCSGSCTRTFLWCPPDARRSRASRALQEWAALALLIVMGKEPLSRPSCWKQAMYTCLHIKSRLYVFANYQSLMSSRLVSVLVCFEDSCLSKCVCVFWSLMSESVCLCVLKSHVWVGVFLMLLLCWHKRPTCRYIMPLCSWMAW